MPESVYDSLGVPTVINAVGYATRVGGSRPSPAVIEAMAQAQREYIEIDDLQAAAAACIERHTGAAAGIVTCGAGAALTLAAAACLAGNDPHKMDALPDTASFKRNRIIYPQLGEFDYDHAVRLSGAIVDVIDYDAADALQQIRAAIGEQTAAIGYVWKKMGQSPSVKEVAQLANEHSLPLIVDAALSLPPTRHLRSFIGDGAALVALSGGKHLGGPQASGLLFGEENLVRSAWVQMVDMDVRAATWSLGKWIGEGWISHPPRHGIGRSMKVSKEAIVGVLTALNNYEKRDHRAELALWKDTVQILQERLSALDGLKVTPLFPAPNGQPYPTLCIRHDNLRGIIASLRTQRPKVIMAEDEHDASVAYIFPMCLGEGQALLVAEALGTAINSLERR
jgi:L-seryl-tRNA(Ser) seleniumtransferase